MMCRLSQNCIKMKYLHMSNLDFAGPFQGSMFFIAVDAYSKWSEVRVMNSTTTAKTLDVLRDWFAAHGIPHQLVTDNGLQFVVQEFDKVMVSSMSRMRLTILPQTALLRDLSRP